jgi:Adenylosuccinate synthase
MKLDSVVGIVKAYSSCVGEGYFTSELFGEEAELLRNAGGEFGAATGRPRRVGAFDIPATRFGIEDAGCNGNCTY